MTCYSVSIISLSVNTLISTVQQIKISFDFPPTWAPSSDLFFFKSTGYIVLGQLQLWLKHYWKNLHLISRQYKLLCSSKLRLDKLISCFTLSFTDTGAMYIIHWLILSILNIKLNTEVNLNPAARMPNRNVACNKLKISSCPPEITPIRGKSLCLN